MPRIQRNKSLISNFDRGSKGEGAPEPDLPSGWRWVKLGEVCEKPQYGYTASAEFNEVGPKLLRITDIQRGQVNWDTVPYCRCEYDIKKYLLKTGDILFARTGGTTGKSYLIQYLPLKSIFASYLIRVQASDKLQPEYLYLFLQSKFYWQQVEIHKRGGAQPNMNATLLSNIILPLPPLPEQKRISSKIKELMKEVERARTACEKQLEAAKALPAAYLREVFESEDAKKWERRKIGEVCQINPRRPKSFTRSLNESTTFIPMAAINERTGNIANPQVVPYSNVSKGYTYFEDGDVLFAKITPCMQNGKHVIAKKLIDGLGFGTTEFHVLRPNSILLSEWLYLFIRRPKFLEEAANYFTGTAGQQRVPKEFLADYTIPLPTLSVQQNIVSQIKEKMAYAENLCDGIEKQIKTINALPQSILRKAFRGKL